MPTSMTAAPGLTQSPCTMRGLPTAATRMSARWHTAPRSRVCEWQTVTVALAFRSRAAIGLPTMFERPTTTALAPASEVWIFGTDGTLRLEADARRLWGGRRGDRELREIAIPAEQRIGWRVEEEFVNAIRGREKVLRTTFEDGARYMEFTEAVARSAALGQAIDVADL